MIMFEICKTVSNDKTLLFQIVNLLSSNLDMFILFFL